MDSKPTEAELREVFARANHSATLEGLEITPDMLARQEQVIRGQLTVEEAIAESAAAASARDRATATKPA